MKIFSVGQVNNYIKTILSHDYMLRSVAIKGEVSNCKYHSMGHIYFRLKDETGSIPAVMFKKNAESGGLDFTLRDGQSVIVTGSVSVYERDGCYQLYAQKIKQDGTGRLYEEFERLKQKLNEEGLFDFEYKKDIPKFPKRIGIVTAKTGAAIQDIMNIAKRRNPYVQLVLYPAKVQGEGAADTIVRGIEVLDRMNLDTIIVGRGGGSIEDLWAFNEEKVARAIFDAKTPIISGTGHEIDTTLADYAADKRAPTPSAACELAIPDIMGVLRELEEKRQKIETSIKNRLVLFQTKLSRYESFLEARSPMTKLTQKTQYLSQIYDRLQLGMRRKLDHDTHRLELFTAKLNGLSPTAKLINGFGYVEKEDRPVFSTAGLEKNDMLKITLHDGTIHAKVTEVNYGDEERK